MELAALDQFKKSLNLLLENYSKYFDDLLSGERSLPFGLLVLRCTRSHKEACKYQNTFLSGINNFMRVASCKTCLIAYTIKKGPDQAAH